MSIKRFVAGAVCPRCSAMDRLRTWRDDSNEYRECIDCGYTDSMRLDGTQPPAELQTRVNQTPKAEPEAGVQVLNFVPRKKTTDS